jgi:hypothetical protein
LFSLYINPNGFVEAYIHLRLWVVKRVFFFFWMFLSMSNPGVEPIRTNKVETRHGRVYTGIVEDPAGCPKRPMFFTLGVLTKF